MGGFVGGGGEGGRGGGGRRGGRLYILGRRQYSMFKGYSLPLV